MATTTKYLFIDLSGRGVKSRLTVTHIRNNWDLSQVSDNNEQLLSDYLDNSELGDTWECNDTKLTHI